MGWSTVISGAFSLLGQNQQANAQRDAMRMQQQMYARQQAALAPYAQAGQGAATALSNALLNGQLPEQLQNSAAYQFRMNQGMNKVNNQLARTGMRLSGRGLKAINATAQNIASDETNNYLRHLFNMANMGMQGVTGNNAAMEASTQVQANQRLQEGNAMGAFLNQAGSWAGSKIDNYLTQTTPNFSSGSIQNTFMGDVPSYNLNTFKG